MFYEDQETYGLLLVYDRCAGTALMDADQHAMLGDFIRDRRNMVRAGVLRCPEWFQLELNRLDTKLRAWWDAHREEWVIDRLQDEGYYLTVIHFKPSANFQLNQQLIDAMRANDMQRYTSPKEYLAAKRAAAEQVRKQKEEASSDKVRAAVDKLSSKQIENFIAVEEAIQSGETINAHGRDAEILEKATRHRLNEQKQAEARGEILAPVDDSHNAINPGMHPAIYRRERST